jgi:hypothetical protein
VFAVGLAVTGGSLLALHAVQPRPSGALEVGVLVAAGVGATLVRSALFRGWVFRPSPVAPVPAQASALPPSAVTAAA